MKERIYSGPIKETPETILKDVANSFNNLDLKNPEAVTQKIEELKKKGLILQVKTLEEMSKKYLELTKVEEK